MLAKDKHLYEYVEITGKISEIDELKDQIYNMSTGDKVTVLVNLMFFYFFKIYDVFISSRDTNTLAFVRLYFYS